jgi:hypothetical protein
VIVSIVVVAALAAAMTEADSSGRASGGSDPSTSTTQAPATTSSSTLPPIEAVGHLDVVTHHRVECGSQLPISVDVPGAQPIDGPVPDTPPPDHQVVKHWNAADHTIELRWPADRRQLSSPGGAVVAFPMVGSWGSNGHTTSAYVNASDTTGSQLFSLTDVDGVDLSHLSPACSVVQLRVTKGDGSMQTLGFGIPTAGIDPLVVDLGPLVGLHRTSPERLPRDRTLACPDRVQRRSTVRVDAASASPSEALRTFLESDAAAVVPRPAVPRPFEETFMQNDGTYRYEHYLAWSTYVAITVAPTDGGWAVTNWENGEC